jgi:hypothetical protein
MILEKARKYSSEEGMMEKSRKGGEEAGRIIGQGPNGRRNDESDEIG